MNLPVHSIVGGIGAIGVSRFFGAENTVAFFCSSIFVDVDHYIFYVWKFHDLSIKKAVQYFNDNRDTERFCLCAFHTVEFLLLVGLITAIFGSVFVYVCFAGFLLHYVIDVFQGLYYKRMHYRWWTITNYYRFTREKIYEY